MMVCERDLEEKKESDTYKKRKMTLIALFFIICLIPTVFMKLAGGGLTENRKLSEMPSIFAESGELNQQFFSEWDTYFSEHFAFRAQLVEANSYLQYYVFHTAADDQVVIGRDGWLFFDQTMKDYMGSTLTEEEVEQIGMQLAQASDVFAKQGKELVIMIAPNKNAVYSEYMAPKYGQKQMEDNYTALLAKLEDEGVRTLDLRSALLQAKQSNQVYHKLDTHWNTTGAMAVLNELYDTIGIEKEYTLEGYREELDHEPDLEMILFPGSYRMDVQHVYDGDIGYTSEGRIRSMDDVTIQTKADEGCGKKIVMYRDSFGRALIPLVASTFDEAVFLRATPYDLATAADIDCDIVVIEIAERNIPDLLEVTF